MLYSYLLRGYFIFFYKLFEIKFLVIRYWKVVNLKKLNKFFLIKYNINVMLFFILKNNFLKIFFINF